MSESKYYTNPTGFLDKTKLIELSGDEVFLILKDGTRKKSATDYWTPSIIAELVRNGDFVEVDPSKKEPKYKVGEVLTDGPIVGIIEEVFESRSRPEVFVYALKELVFGDLQYWSEYDIVRLKTVCSSS